LGQQSEQQAKAYLTSLGYSFLTANFHTRYGEIDLIFQDNSELVCVEVKSRINNHFGYPQEAVTPAKLSKIKISAQLYAQKYSFKGPIRIDVIAINPRSLEHLKNVGW